MAEIFLVLNLKKVLKKSPDWKKSDSAMRVLRSVLQKKTKTDKVKIGKALNEYLWRNGIKKPPTKLKVRVTKSDQQATADIVL